MNEPIPTPFDITSIPYIAWEPGARDWMLAFSVFAAALVGIGLAALLLRLRSTDRALTRLLKQLSESSVSAPGLECERFSRLCRRILSFLVGLDLSGCTAQELRGMAQATQDEREAEMLGIVAAIEDWAYAPAGAADPATIASLAARARESLHELAKERRVR